MKKLLVFAAAFAILIAGCSKPEGPKTETKPKELADPELSIAGVPAAAIESGTSFTFTVSTKSSGAITITVDKPTVASVQTVGDREYKITASSPQDVVVTITASQAEVKKEYKASTAKAS